MKERKREEEVENIEKQRKTSNDIKYSRTYETRYRKKREVEKLLETVGEEAKQGEEKNIKSRGREEQKSGSIELQQNKGEEAKQREEKNIKSRGREEQKSGSFELQQNKEQEKKNKKKREYTQDHDKMEQKNENIELQQPQKTIASLVNKESMQELDDWERNMSPQERKTELNKLHARRDEGFRITEDVKDLVQDPNNKEVCDAVEALMEAAHQKNGLILILLGFLFLEGVKVKKDPYKAFYLLFHACLYDRHIHTLTSIWFYRALSNLNEQKNETDEQTLVKINADWKFVADRHFLLDELAQNTKNTLNSELVKRIIYALCHLDLNELFYEFGEDYYRKERKRRKEKLNSFFSNLLKGEKKEKTDYCKKTLFDLFPIELIEKVQKHTQFSDYFFEGELVINQQELKEDKKKNENNVFYMKLEAEKTSYKKVFENLQKIDPENKLSLQIKSLFEELQLKKLNCKKNHWGGFKKIHSFSSETMQFQIEIIGTWNAVSNPVLQLNSFFYQKSNFS